MPRLAKMPLVKPEETEHDDFADDGAADHSEDDGTIYRPRPQLSKPPVLMRSLAWLMNGLENETIDVNPEYQREVVWAAGRMTGLVNSLMENYYIPPIILNKKKVKQENGKVKHIKVCVDGKQRLTSVKAFIQGMIPCHDCKGRKWYFCQGDSTRRQRILPEEVQKQFLVKELVSFEFSDLSVEQEEDLFARVQMGVQLSQAEKMRASTGPWQELAKLYVEDFDTVFSLAKDRARAKDFQLALACFSQIIEVHHPTRADGEPQLRTAFASLPKLLQNKDAVDDNLRSHLAIVFNKYKILVDQDSDTFNNSSNWLTKVKTFSPIELVAVAVLISLYSESRNNNLLLGDIRALRITLRDQFDDLRMNTKTWEFIWQYIDNLEAYRGAVNGSTVQRRTEPPTPEIKKEAVEPRPLKRQREDSGHRPQPQPQPQHHYPNSVPASQAVSQRENTRSPQRSVALSSYEKRLGTANQRWNHQKTEASAPTAHSNPNKRGGSSTAPTAAMASSSTLPFHNTNSNASNSSKQSRVKRLFHQSQSSGAAASTYQPLNVPTANMLPSPSSTPQPLPPPHPHSGQQSASTTTPLPTAAAGPPSPQHYAPSPNLHQGPGAYAPPAYTQQHWDGVVETASASTSPFMSPTLPQQQLQRQAPPASRRQSSGQISNQVGSVRRSSGVQAGQTGQVEGHRGQTGKSWGDTIDLTGDDAEEERRALLSAFKNS